MKISQLSSGAATARGRERILVRADVPAIRYISALMLLCVLGWLTLLAMREHLGYERVAPRPVREVSGVADRSGPDWRAAFFLADR